MAPSVRWRRRLRREGGRSWTLPPYLHSQSRHRTLERRHGSRYGEHVRRPPITNPPTGAGSTPK
ncbi:hypothetical protein PJI17_17075 [Mycobacterium kansasii]|uniref:Uncharacterized protein n=1 Tax=Mycobacterium kansasii TaxID=1768 RepID=A0A1V3X9P5_MYCKA|nr:hypothetical protein BZL30_3126 [Mycobacterium kansasii]